MSIRRPKTAKDNPNISSTTPLTTPIVTANSSLHTFKEANLEADKACKLQQQASQLLLQKADTFILELKQLHFTDYWMPHELQH